MRRIFSRFQKLAATIFSRVITKKPSKIVKFTKIHQTLRNTYLTGPKWNRIKLVVPPNLLKQENVCLIPREAKHPILSCLSYEVLLVVTHTEMLKIQGENRKFSPQGPHCHLPQSFDYYKYFRGDCNSLSPPPLTAFTSFSIQYQWPPCFLICSPPRDLNYRPIN